MPHGLPYLCSMKYRAASFPERGSPWENVQTLGSVLSFRTISIHCILFVRKERTDPTAFMELAGRYGMENFAYRS